MLINIHTHGMNNVGIEIFNLPNTVAISGFYSFGIHPWKASEESWNVDKIIPLISNKSCLAIGEIGLDKLKGPDLNIQSKIFNNQIELSESLEKPVILHCVKSWNELKSLKRKIKPSQSWIYHGFSKASILDDVLNEGLYISIGSEILTNNTLQEAIRKIPLNRLFLETDDSDISIIEVYEKVSELKDLPLSELEISIENNFIKVFKR